MRSLPISMGKRVGESIKAGWRFLCQPILPLLPDGLANRFPFLGRVCVRGPDGLRLQLHTYGPHGKDRIAIKLARRGLWGYEGETIRVFLALVKEARTVIDIGANTGLFALLAAKRKPECRVWAFEPVPFIFDMLLRNIQLNQLNNVEAISAAVSDFVGESSFYITRTQVGIPTDSSTCPGFRDQVDEFHLPTTTLDEYVKSRQMARLDLLKIDAESAESKVIRGALQTIERDRPLLILEVLENVDHGFVQHALQSLHYHFYHITPECLERRYQLHGSLNVEQRNYLFVPIEKVCWLMDLCGKAGIVVGESSVSLAS